MSSILYRSELEEIISKHMTEEDVERFKELHYIKDDCEVEDIRFVSSIMHSISDGDFSIGVDIGGISIVYVTEGVEEFSTFGGYFVIQVGDEFYKSNISFSSYADGPEGGYQFEKVMPVTKQVVEYTV